MAVWVEKLTAFTQAFKGAINVVLDYLNKIVALLISIFRTISQNIKMLAENKDNLKIIIPALLILYVGLEIIKSLEKRPEN